MIVKVESQLEQKVVRVKLYEDKKKSEAKKK
jgi:hypothetical protein